MLSLLRVEGSQLVAKLRVDLSRRLKKTFLKFLKQLGGISMSFLEIVELLEFQEHQTIEGITANNHQT
jgi:hypothetical protein